MVPDNVAKFRVISGDLKEIFGYVDDLSGNLTEVFNNAGSTVPTSITSSLDSMYNALDTATDGIDDG